MLNKAIEAIGYVLYYAVKGVNFARRKLGMTEI